jgi:ABC-2 type transport system permease protein
MEFRANFAAQILQNLVWISFFLLILLVVYGNTKSVAGWTRGEGFVLAATGFLLSAINTCLFFSLHEIPEQVRMGLLDFVVTRPIDSQFWVSTRRFSFSQVGTVAGAATLLFFGFREANLSPSFAQAAAFAVLVLCASAIFYSLTLSLMATAIWFVRVDNLWVLADSISQISRFPLDIYGVSVRWFLTFVIPLGFLATFPAKQLVQGFDPRTLALGITWAVVSLAASRTFWRYALRYYGSASS